MHEAVVLVAVFFPFLPSFLPSFRRLKFKDSKSEAREEERRGRTRRKKGRTNLSTPSWAPTAAPPHMTRRALAHFY